MNEQNAYHEWFVNEAAILQFTISLNEIIVNLETCFDL